MKKIFIVLISVGFLVSCGKSKTGKQIADEVCDCSKKANALPVSDSNRTKAQDDCNLQNQKAWAKVKDDVDKAKEFNETISACATEQIKKSFGQ